MSDTLVNRQARHNPVVNCYHKNRLRIAAKDLTRSSRLAGIRESSEAYETASRRGRLCNGTSAVPRRDSVELAARAKKRRPRVLLWEQERRKGTDSRRIVLARPRERRGKTRAALRAWPIGNRAALKIADATKRQEGQAILGETTKRRGGETFLRRDLEPSWRDAVRNRYTSP